MLILTDGTCKTLYCVTNEPVPKNRPGSLRKMRQQTSSSGTDEPPPAHPFRSFTISKSGKAETFRILSRLTGCPEAFRSTRPVGEAVF
jgi:hypothetical protein